MSALHMFALGKVDFEIRAEPLYREEAWLTDAMVGVPTVHLGRCSLRDGPMNLWNLIG